MIRFFHYDIHEYLLLEEELNKLGAKGYSTNSISTITRFKKTDHPVYYLTDVFTSDEKSIVNKENEKMRYIDYYLERDYELISHFKDILVFKGEQQIKPKQKLINNLSEKKKANRILQFFLSILLVLFIFITFISPLKPYHLLTNGKILFYSSLLFIALSIMLRCFVKYNGIMKLSSAIKRKQEYDTSHIKIYHKISIIFPIICILLFIFSLVLDIYDTSYIDVPSNMITLKDFSINDKSEISIVQKSSFIIPKSIEYLETVDDNALYIQSFDFRNQKQANDLLNEYINDPNTLYLSSIKKNDDYYLGYLDNKVHAIITLKDTTLTIINTDFVIDEQSISKITAK